MIAEMSELFAGAKAIAVAKYQGTSVAELQEIRGIDGRVDHGGVLAVNFTYAARDKI